MHEKLNNIKVLTNVTTACKRVQKMTISCITTVIHTTASPVLLPLPTFCLKGQLFELCQLSRWPQKVNFCQTVGAILSTERTPFVSPTPSA